MTWWQFLMTLFDDNFWWQFLMTIFDDNFWWHFWWQFLWHFLMKIFDDNYWWQFLLTILSNLTIFYNFNFVWQFLTFYDNFGQFLTILDNRLTILTIETIFDKWKDSPGDSTFETLSTILTIENLNSDNHSYMTINCDTGQHSQFLRCFNSSRARV